MTRDEPDDILCDTLDMLGTRLSIAWNCAGSSRRSGDRQMPTGAQNSTALQQRGENSSRKRRRTGSGWLHQLPGLWRRLRKTYAW